MKDALRSVIAELPGVRALRARRYERTVRTTDAWKFWGVFSSYEDALAAVPDNPVLRVGYDTPGMAGRGREDYERMHAFDYPALLALLQFAGVTTPGVEAAPLTVFDLGGHLGSKYRAFLRHWTPPHGFRWIVCETPATVAAADALSAADLPDGLSFTTDLAALDGADVLYASGVLAYLDQNLWEILDAVEQPPANLILNKVPLTSGNEFWTIQNASGLAAVPYHVFRRDAFFAALAERGYQTVDEWIVPERTVEIPFRPGFGTDAGTGMSLSRGRSTR